MLNDYLTGSQAKTGMGRVLRGVLPSRVLMQLKDMAEITNCEYQDSRVFSETFCNSMRDYKYLSDRQFVLMVVCLIDPEFKQLFDYQLGKNILRGVCSSHVIMVLNQEFLGCVLLFDYFYILCILLCIQGKSGLLHKFCVV